MAEGDFDVTEARNRAREAFCAQLTEAIRRDTYPSSTMMDIVEANLSPEQLPDYLDMLMDKVADERFPSMDMVRRIMSLT